MPQISEDAIIVRRLAPTFGGELSGLRLSPQTLAQHADAIRRAFLDSKVLVLRDQQITPSVFSAFGELFGEPDPHHVVAMRHPEQPNLTVLSNQDEPGRKPQAKYFGAGWHSDYSYKAVPAAATMLLAMEVPEEGGDTLFADMEAAFADLPEVEKAKLRRLRVRHQYRWSPDRADPWARWTFLSESEQAATPENVHPLVRRHPETGRESLLIAPRVIGSVIGIEGMDEAESDALIDDLMRHAVADRFVYRHRYRPWDIVVWDNRCSLHCATTDTLAADRVRRMLRITTRGLPPIPA
jgi:taurine dioxygenase